MARTEIVEFKVDADEKARLKGYACDRGEPLGTYVRKAALSFPEYGKAPVPYETEQDKANKAKVRKAIENKESYEVKVEPGSVREDYAEKAVRVDWIDSRTKQLKGRMSTRNAEAQAKKEWDAR